MNKLAIVIIGALLCAACPPTTEEPRDPSPCSAYLPLNWNGETMSIEGSHPDLAYVALDMTYKGIVKAGQDFDLFGLEERGTPQQGPPWKITRTFACRDGRTEAVSLLDDCSFPEPMPLAWDDMSPGWTQAMDTTCEEFGWGLTGTMSVPDCDTRETPLGEFKTCAMRWEMQADFTPEDDTDATIPWSVQISFAKGIGPIHWDSMVLTQSSLVDED